MTRTPDEIKKGLECCKEDECFGDRQNCPYTADPKLCVGVMCADALALIQQLQAQNAEQAERIQQLEAERDALMVAAKGECHECKFSDCSFTEAPCDSCFSAHRSKWEWRGVQKEE